jgi:hypothetical protein
MPRSGGAAPRSTFFSAAVRRIANVQPHRILVATPSVVLVADVLAVVVQRFVTQGLGRLGLVTVHGGLALEISHGDGVALSPVAPETMPAWHAVEDEGHHRLSVLTAKPRKLVKN